MANENAVKSGGIGVLGLLGVLFVALKLIGISPVAHWSWWWVTAPFWGGFAIVIGFLLVMAAFVGLLSGVAAICKHFGW